MDSNYPVTCERCGKRHLSGFTFLELNSRTNQYARPGTVPAADSQGLFRFGTTCARRVLASTKDVTTP